MRLLYYDDQSPEAISLMGYRELRMWSELSEIKLQAKYPNVEKWG